MCHPEAEHDALLLYMLRMRGEGSAPLFFRVADQPSKSWIVLQCSGADPSASQKPCRNTFQFAWLAFTMARHGMRWIVNCDLYSGYGYRMISVQTWSAHKSAALISMQHATITGTCRSDHCPVGFWHLGAPVQMCVG